MLIVDMRRLHETVSKQENLVKLWYHTCYSICPRFSYSSFALNMPEDETNSRKKTGNNNANYGNDSFLR